MARCDAARVRLLTRNGHDRTYRFPLIREAVEALRLGSCLVDDEPSRTTVLRPSRCCVTGATIAS